MKSHGNNPIYLKKNLLFPWLPPEPPYTPSNELLAWVLGAVPWIFGKKLKGLEENLGIITKIASVGVGAPSPNIAGLREFSIILIFLTKSAQKNNEIFVTWFNLLILHDLFRQILEIFSSFGGSALWTHHYSLSVLYSLFSP